MLCCNESVHFIASSLIKITFYVEIRDLFVYHKVRSKYADWQLLCHGSVHQAMWARYMKTGDACDRWVWECFVENQLLAPHPNRTDV